MYTPMQYRVWAEMIVGGVHTSTDNSPTSTMFIRAGGGTKKKSDLPYNSITGSGNSPAKTIENRSKCYKQLSDLKNLLDTGVLSLAEFDEEKATVISALQRLKEV